MKKYRDNAPLAILSIMVLTLVLFCGISAICCAIVKPYEYQGSTVVDLAQYQKLVKRYSGTKTLQATAYDSTADKILVTYNFDGYKDTGAQYGIPNGTRLNFFVWLGR